MRIAHLVTACAALITAFYRVETVNLDRWPQSKDQSVQQRTENATDISDITFTTLQPEVSSFSQNAPSNHYFGSKKRPGNVRPNRSMSLRGLNSMKVDRRRRQLQRLARASTKGSASTVKVSATPDKVVHDVGRSYDTGDSQMDAHEIEPVQAAEAFGDGAIHIEPIYRVTKNKGILDSLMGILRRVVEPPQSVGPLVGPFNFPGVGDKVYIRLLEPVQPNHLLVRLVTHLPVAESEVTFDKNILLPSALLSHSEVPSISHESLVLSADTLPSSIASGHHSNIAPNLISSDSLLSSSDNLAQVAKPPSTLAHGVLAKGQFKQPYVSTIFKVNLQNGDLTNVHRVARHHKTIQRPTSASKDGQVASSSYPKYVDPRNNSQDTQYLRPNTFPGPLDHPYQFYGAVNDSRNERPFSTEAEEPFKPMNISSFKPVAQAKPFHPLNNPIFNQFHVKSSTTPRYSLNFVSKNMRYLNMDGGVETASDTLNDNGGFKPMEQSPALQKMVRSVNHQWDSFKKVHSEPKGVDKPSAGTDRGHRVLEDRIDNGGGESSDAYKRSSIDHPQSAALRQPGAKLEDQAVRCSRCPQEESEKKSNDQDESGISNSMPMAMQLQATVNSTLKQTMQLLHLQEQLDLVKRNSTRPRDV